MIIDKSQWPQTALRPVVGIGLIYHAGRFLFTSAGYANFVHMLGEVPLPWPAVTAVLVASLELIGGLAILTGTYTVLFSLLVAFEMATRVGVILLIGRGFPKPLDGQPPLPDTETNLLYIGMLLALAVAGAGLFSVDHWRDRPSPEPDLHYGRRPRVARRRAIWS